MAVSTGTIADLRTAEELREAILAELRIHDVVEIDCSEVIEADLSLLQLLAATRRLALREGKDARVAPPVSPALGALAQRAGFAGDAQEAWAAFWQAGASVR
jgi:anti-anti-sigma regulatory factor